MPIEIKELHIRVSVDNGTSQSSGSTTNTASAPNTEPDPALLQACVDKVLEILAKKAER